MFKKSKRAVLSDKEDDIHTEKDDSTAEKTLRRSKKSVSQLLKAKSWKYIW